MTAVSYQETLWAIVIGLVVVKVAAFLLLEAYIKWWS